MSALCGEWLSTFLLERVVLWSQTVGKIVWRWIPLSPFTIGRTFTILGHLLPFGYPHPLFEHWTWPNVNLPSPLWGIAFTRLWSHTDVTRHSCSRNHSPKLAADQLPTLTWYQYVGAKWPINQQNFTLSPPSFVQGGSCPPVCNSWMNHILQLGFWNQTSVRSSMGMDVPQKLPPCQQSELI